MSYVKTTWKTGDTVTAEKLNNAEQGIAQNAHDIETINDSIEDLSADANELKNTLTLNSNELFDEVSEVGITTTIADFKLNDSGYRISDANYTITTHRVFAGDVIKVVSGHKFQFQNTTTVTTSGTLYRIGNTYGAGTYYLTVPAGATYVVLSTPDASEAKVYKVKSAIGSVADNLDALSDSTDTRFEEVSTMIGCKPIEYLKGTYIEATSPITFTGGHPYQNAGSTAFMSAYVACSEGDVFTVSGYNTTSTIRVWLFCDANGAILSAANPSTDITNEVITAPANAAWLCINSKRLTDASYIGKLVNQQIEDAVEPIDRVAEKNLSAIYNAYASDIADIPCAESAVSARVAIDVNVPTFLAGNGYIVYAPIVAGTKIRIKKEQTAVCIVCFTATTPAAGTAITHYSIFTGLENTNIVAESQSGDEYVAVYSSTSITADNVSFYYSQSARGTVELIPQLDAHMVNLLKYRPVGRVSKAYIALSCDDGIEPLATYTLPRIKYWSEHYGKDIPLHMALFDNSPVFANAEYTALIKDMCENHDCSIGIHGPSPFTSYTSVTELYAFLKKQEQAIIDKTGVTPTSVIYPHSAYNDKIMTMCGSWYGICGASGTDASPYTYKDDQNLYMYVGEKSNCYEVYRLSIKDTRIGSAAGAQRIIDYAIANNLIICPYFHDIDFTEYSEETNNFNKAMLDAYIQYGMEKGVEFVNFGDIPKLL